MSTQAIGFIVLFIIALLAILAGMQLNRSNKKNFSKKYFDEVVQAVYEGAERQRIPWKTQIEDSLDCLVNGGTVKIVSATLRKPILVKLNVEAVPHNVEGRHYAYHLLSAAMTKAKTVKWIECIYPNTN